MLQKTHLTLYVVFHQNDYWIIGVVKDKAPRQLCFHYSSGPGWESLCCMVRDAGVLLNLKLSCYMADMTQEIDTIIENNGGQAAGFFEGDAMDWIVANDMQSICNAAKVVNLPPADDE